MEPIDAMKVISFPINSIFEILWNMEYSKILLQHDIFLTFWNIEYSKNNGNKENIEIGGIWNIRGIFPKDSKTIKISKNFGIWNIPWNIPGIFQKL